MTWWALSAITVAGPCRHKMRRICATFPKTNANLFSYQRCFIRIVPTSINLAPIFVNRARRIIVIKRYTGIMTTLKVRFDGQVLVPEEPVDDFRRHWIFHRATSAARWVLQAVITTRTRIKTALQVLAVPFYFTLICAFTLSINCRASFTFCPCGNCCKYLRHTSMPFWGCFKSNA